MAKTLASDVNTVLAARQRTPILLVEFYLDSGTLYLARTLANVYFPDTPYDPEEEERPETDQLYTARAIEVGSIAQSAEGQIQGCTISVDDVAGTFRALLAAGEEFQWKQIIMKRVYAGYLADASNYYEFFNGYINQVNSVSKRTFDLGVSAGTPLETRMMNWMYQKPCGWRFGDANCKINRTSLSVSGYASGGSTTTLIDAGVLTHADNYWKHGIVQITIGANVYTRKISSSDSSDASITFDVAIPEPVVNATTYQVWKGCDQTLVTCNGEGPNAWGPDTDNTANFGGFLDIPTGPVDTGDRRAVYEAAKRVGEKYRRIFS
jgi:uncharacterized phage protein (TIGR02218 family)